MTAPLRHNSEIRTRLGLRQVINVSGTMTSLGASIITEPAIAAMAEIAPEWVEIDDLQRRASATIARLTGAEAGFVTACCAAGISMTIAGAMTGIDLLAMERLPNDTRGLRTEVLLQAGHAVNYGAPVDQSVRLVGGRVVTAGTVTAVQRHHVENAITDNTVALLHVVSHHTVQYGLLSLEEVVEICRPRGVPVIVDAASEYDLRGFLARGADIVIYSGHKFLSGPTSGLVAGRKDLVRAAYLQNKGIGRAMKVGKESIAGVMAALDAWETRDHSAVRARETGALGLWHARLNAHPGLHARITPDPTHNPLDRLEVAVAPESGFTAYGLAKTLSAGEPPVIVRDHEAELGFFYLDPCNLHDGEAEVVADAFERVMAAPRPEGAMAVARRSLASTLQWPD
ncbi:aminotransferase class V-fold PLP-dependent enzyme [Mangrovibrevibacter kandeliae]|uniref:aminotransferase class V-fold PLP-dependent enzyme n=1 Tax=Mangrovibrevibacter kandeliae TaxID=2968473 RepID=UPI0021182A4B|nr:MULTISPECIES: aminotransferase class V-fold PLP-dependent enzyme [unclassified Aurantimonas]MCQ8781613.1 aminotransferase class V-fold PLP-dependent enzyme [Aurantimonas sp. CSK15Z-1]MCW4114941.1 aminotransferase class V-fold PLP-dependent enzyme [Aurantimonas sp. MSK8Z-1]